jgi:hypothetical protein
MRLVSFSAALRRFALRSALCLAAILTGAPAPAQETDATFWLRERERRRVDRPRVREAPVLMRRTQPPRRLAPPRPNRHVAPVEQPGGAPPTPEATAAPDQPGVAAAPAAEGGVRPPAPPVAGTGPAAAARPQFNVAVIGDSLGQMLGQGLVEAFAERPDIGVLRKARENSGLVRDDYYDWPKAVRDLLGASEKVDLAIIIVGSNDRQAIRDGGAYVEPLTPRWKELYAARVAAIAEAFRARDIRLVWVGLPIMRSQSMALGATALNDIYREQAARGGAAFVDTWGAFADERGQYSDYGPDVNGQIVRLRSADGVHFTRAGTRKLAHFVEGGIRNLIRETMTPSQPAVARVDPAAPVAPVTPAPPKDVGPAAPPPRPPIGPVLPLNALSASPGAELARPIAASPMAAPPNVPPRLGRADDFTWRRN